MFGYIKPVKAELRVREWEAYQGVYCGLCKRLGKEYGFLPRMALSYDFVFLAVLSMALREEEIPFCRETCMVHPFKRRTCCKEQESISLSCAVAALLLHHKLLDNLADGNLAERLLVRLAMPFSKKAYRKACARLPSLAGTIAEQMACQVKLEKENCPSVDRACEPTANCMAAVFSMLSEDPSRIRVLERLGYLLGRWVYLIDALDDYWDDGKKKNYNPFLAAAPLVETNNKAYAEQDGKDASMGQAPQDFDPLEDGREQVVGSLYLTTAEITKTYDLLDIRPMGCTMDSILKNIVSQGLLESVDRIRKKQDEKTSG